MRPSSSLVNSIASRTSVVAATTRAASNLLGTSSLSACLTLRNLIASSIFLRSFSVLSTSTMTANTAFATATSNGAGVGVTSASGTGRPSTPVRSKMMSSWRRNLSFMSLSRKQRSISITSVPSVASTSSSDEECFSRASTRRQFSSTKATPSTAGASKLSSSRAQEAIKLLPSYLIDARAITQYSPTTPDGALQLSVAENQLSEFPVEGLVGIQEPTVAGGITTLNSRKGGMRLVDVLSQLASSNIPRPEDDSGRATNVFETDMIYYQPTQGVPSVRTAMAAFLQNLLATQSKKFNPDNIVLGAGCNAVLENLVMCLADAGDALLIPTPYYAAFEFDLVSRAGCKIVPVNTMEYAKEGGEVPKCKEAIAPEFYYPNKSSLDAAYNNAVEETGRPPRVLVLSHPNNPLGICYPPSVMKECIEWCNEREVHLISDEIYAGSVYRKERKEEGGHTFVSAMALGSNDDSESTSTGLSLGPYVHLVYAFSKDFALSGLRVGVAYTENEDILMPLQKLNDLCQISSQTQLLVERMLSANAVIGNENDTSQKFVDVYLNANQDNVRARCDKLLSKLDEFNIPHLPADSGLFVWMDFREFLPSLPAGVTEATESLDSMEIRERKLYLSLMKEYGLLFTPGMSMRNERAGFFRFVFTAASDEEFDLGLERLTTFVEEMRR